MFNWYFASGDIGFYWKEQLESFGWLPQILQKDQVFGFNGLLSLWLDYPFRLVLKTLSTVGLSWFVIEKLLWLSVFLLAARSSYILAKSVLGKHNFLFLAPVVYVANTYFLLLFSGGQLGVAWAYAFSPWVLSKLIESLRIQKKFELRPVITNGLFLALLVVFDLRLAYLTISAFVLYIVVRIISEKKYTLHALYHYILTLVLSLIVAMTVHLYWILPTVLASRGTASLGEQFTGIGMLKFLSFADFSHTLSFIHPNWPENLFGKVYFLQPEFLIIPILACMSLWFLKQKTSNRQQIVYFALLAFVGAFLAKGVNEPFGGIFQWMFGHIPGFVMFRDPTKFYVFIAIGYSLLIPFTLGQIASGYKGLRQKQYPILHVLFLCFWMFTLRAVFTSSVRGNFQPMQLPAEYTQFKNLLVSDPTPSRVLWIPAKENFAFASDTHPLLTSAQLFKDASPSAIIAMTRDPEFLQRLYDAGVKYVVVPQDVRKRIFLTDYRYDPTQRDTLITALRLSGLQKVDGFDEVAIFENTHFFFHIDVPPLTLVQQKLSIIGLVISGFFLAFWSLALIFI